MNTITCGGVAIVWLLSLQALGLDTIAVYDASGPVTSDASKVVVDHNARTVKIVDIPSGGYYRIYSPGPDVIESVTVDYYAIPEIDRNPGASFYVYISSTPGSGTAGASRLGYVDLRLNSGGWGKLTLGASRVATKWGENQWGIPQTTRVDEVQSITVDQGDIVGTIDVAGAITSVIDARGGGSILANITSMGAAGTIQAAGSIGTSSTRVHINVKGNITNIIAGSGLINADINTKYSGGSGSILTSASTPQSFAGSLRTNFLGGILTVGGQLTAALYIEGFKINIIDATGGDVIVNYPTGQPRSLVLYKADATYPGIIKIGRKGQRQLAIGSNGTLCLGDSAHPDAGTIQERITTPNEGPVSLVVQKSGSAAGILKGWSVDTMNPTENRLNLTGTFTNDGVVIASGFGPGGAGTDTHVLDLTMFSGVTNLNDNAAAQANGWFAENHGKLILPDVAISGAGTYNWGEAPYAQDSQIDLVNSVQAYVAQSVSGPLTIALLANDRTTEGPVEGLWNAGYTAIGIWAFEDVPFAAANLTFRYDHTNPFILNPFPHAQGLPNPGWSEQRLALAQFSHPTGPWMVLGHATDIAAHYAGFAGASVRDGDLFAIVEHLPGDVCLDGYVDIFDVIDTTDAFGSIPGDPTWNAGADFDGDEQVTIFDVIDVVSYFGTDIRRGVGEGARGGGSQAQSTTAGCADDNANGVPDACEVLEIVAQAGAIDQLPDETLERLLSECGACGW